jgi:hypothetical protein
MMIRAASAAAVLLAAITSAAPAEARLGESFLRFRQSALIQGDTLFRFEGRVGARFRFGPAPRCRVGSGMLLLDTQDGIVVQQTIILPLPRHSSDQRRIDGIAVMFLEDAGLGKKEVEEAMTAFRDTYSTAKPVEKQLGPEKKLNLNTFTNPQLGHILLAVGIKPEGQAPEATPAP